MDFFHPGQLQQVLALVATLLLSGALAAAPGDESSTCQWSDPETQRVLMDSNRYSNLIKTRETVRVWREFDVDGGGPGNSWVYSTGGQCARQVESCSYFAGTQNNWLFTQHILKRIPASNYQTRIYVDVSYSGLICSSTVDAKVFYKIENTASDQTTNNRYLQYTSQLMGLPCGGSSPVLSSFVLSEGQDGFYIAIQDPGACVTIRRLFVYRKRCPSRQVGLVLYPETPAPLTDVSVEANCVSNAAGTGLTLTCNSEGVWSGTPQCQCSPGYRTEGSSCTACQPGTFRSPTDSPSSCINCPANTITTEPHTGICQCMEGFFRTAEERANDGCSSPPSQVQNLRINTADTTSITLTWNRPATPGRSDLRYAVDISDPNQLGVFLPFRVFSDSRSTVVLRIMGLTPDTTYIFKVSTRNGVSRFDATNDALREEEVSGTTLASPPGPPIVETYGVVVVWQEPVNPNGKITGYRVRFIRGSRTTIRETNEAYHVIRTGDTPTGSGQLSVQVQANNSAGFGQWSTSVNVDLGTSCEPCETCATCSPREPCETCATCSPPCEPCETCETCEMCETCATCSPPCEICETCETCEMCEPCATCSPPCEPCDMEVILPGVVGDVRMFDETVVWSRPTNTGGEITRYELRFHTSGQLNTVPSRIVSNPNQQWFKPTRSQLPSGRPIYVQIRAVNSAGNGPWSGQNTQYIPPPLITSPGVVGGVRVFDETVVWSRPTNTGGEITRYELRFHTSGQLNTVPSRIVSNPNQQWFQPTQTQLPSGGPIFVQIRAVNSEGNGPWSGQNTRYIPQPLMTPLGVVGDVRVFDDTVVWRRPTNTGGEITRYELRFHTSGRLNTVPSRIVSNPNQQWFRPTQSQLPSGGPIYVQIRAVNSAGNGPWSGQNAQYPPRQTKPGVVENISVENDAVFWSVPRSDGGADITSYKLRFFLSGNEGRVLEQTTNDNWFRPAQSILPTRRPAYVQILAVNSVGRGDWTGQVIFPSRRRLPGSIININVEDGVLTWQAPSFDGGSSITDYNVRFYNQGEQNSVAVLRTTGRVWYRPSIAELPARRPVNVQIRAVNSIGAGQWSSSTVEFCTVCLEEVTPPGTITDVRVFDSTVVWGTPTDTGGEITGYELRLYATGEANSASVLPISDRSQNWYRPTKLPSGRPVLVQVRAVNSADKSSWSNEVTFCNSISCDACFINSPPGVVENVIVLDDTVIWSSPLTTGVTVSGYHLRFSSTLSNETKIARTGPDVQKYRPMSSEIPDQRPIFVDVRAWNNDGNGSWSSKVLYADEPCSVSRVFFKETTICWESSGSCDNVTEYSLRLFHVEENFATTLLVTLGPDMETKYQLNTGTLLCGDNYAVQILPEGGDNSSWSAVVEFKYNSDNKGECKIVRNDGQTSQLSTQNNDITFAISIPLAIILICVLMGFVITCVVCSVLMRRKTKDIPPHVYGHAPKVTNGKNDHFTNPVYKQ